MHLDSRHAPSRSGAVVRLIAAFLAVLASTFALAYSQATAPAGTESWPRFTSSTGFSVAYPSGWHRIGVSTDRLQILSSGGGAEGVIIRRGQALITVIAVGRAGDLQGAVARENRFATVISRRRITVSGTLGPGPICEITSRSPAVPPGDTLRMVPDEISTEFFRPLGSQIIAVRVLNWAGDRHQREYQAVGAAMAASLRDPAGG